MLTLKGRAIGTPAANGTGSTEPTILDEVDAIFAMHLRRVGMVWGLLRMAVGWIFLWAFLDKLVGLGFATEVGKGWLNGGSPTFGFLNFGSSRLRKKGVSVKLPCRWSQEHDDFRP